MKELRSDTKERALSSVSCGSFALCAKRFVDVTFSAMLIIASAPVMLVAALGIWLTSPGPIFFVDKRAGIGNSEFRCFKLRTMCVNQQAVLNSRGLSNVGDAGRLLVHEKDPRINGWGKFLRKTSIDELPQLINVVRGEMSLVGPRALTLSMLAAYPEIRKARSVMRPGLSGLWQVTHRKKNASVTDMVEDDLDYIRRFSVGLDLEILCKTPFRVLEPSRNESQLR